MSAPRANEREGAVSASRVEQEKHKLTETSEQGGAESATCITKYDQKYQDRQ